MLWNLPYRARVPLGLALAVVVTALLVTAVAAQVAARSSKLETLATVNGAIALLRAQARPLLAQDDTWRMYVLLRDTTSILPGHTEGLARAAILDAQGRIVASSEPSALETGRPVPHAQGLHKRLIVEGKDESIALVDPISSEDGQVLGFSYVEVDGPVFKPDWAAMAKPALFGTILAIMLLVPAGWVVGNRMARPIGQLANTISEIGRSDPGALLSSLASERDPEINRIGGAVKQLLVEMEERKRSEEALRESEARFRTLFDHAMDAFFLLDTELKVVDVNRQACEALGYSRDELVGMHPRQFDAKLDERSIESVGVRVGKGETVTFETLHKRRDGTVFPVEVRSRTFVREEQNLYLALARDISERKRTEQTVRAKDQALQAARAELARVSRVMTLGELTASIAHEVNQPLAAMVANAAAVKRWLAADPPQTEKAGRALQSIADDGRRAGEVIKRVRALVQRRPAPLCPLGVNDAIADVIALAQQELRSNGVVLSRILAQDLPSVLGDRIQLQQVLLNLVVNAIEAMSAVTDRPRELTITSGLHEPGAVLVEVSDTGPGLEHEHAEHLFEAFYTTKSEGLGIGLSISRSIIEAHGGRLSAAQNVPQGAVFRFTLPVQGERQRMKDNRAVVFVIDDDASMRGALDNLLSSVGLDVRVFASPQEFLRADRPDTPGCILLDLRLPGMSGLVVQQEFATRGIALPVIFISGYADVPITVRAMKAGAVEFLTKPFHEQELLDAVHTAIERDAARHSEAGHASDLRARFDTLSPREREVMGLVAAGRANKQIAAELGVSLVTVKVHRGHVMHKMLAQSVADLVRMADQLGLRAAPDPIPRC